MNKNIISFSENSYKESMSKWDGIIYNLNEKSRGDLKESLVLQADCIIYRQKLNEEISQKKYLFIIENSFYKRKKREKDEYFLIKYIKTNEIKKKYEEVDLDKLDINLFNIKEYINFLISTRKRIDNFLYSIKNKITVYEITGLD
jgi:hypothetical protein